MNPLLRLIGLLITFHVVCFGWIFFRADSMQRVGEMLTQIATNFHPEVFLQFLSGYKVVSFMMITGYLMHFMPRKAEMKMQLAVTKSPLVIQALILIIAVFIVFQLKVRGSALYLFSVLTNVRTSLPDNSWKI